VFSQAGLALPDLAFEFALTILLENRASKWSAGLPESANVLQVSALDLRIE